MGVWSFQPMVMDAPPGAAVPRGETCFLPIGEVVRW